MRTLSKAPQPVRPGARPDVPQKMLAPGSLGELYKLAAHHTSMYTRRHLLIWNRRRVAPSVKGGGKPRPHSGHKRGGPGPLFGAGETVRETGIYEVIHDRAHRSTHEVVMLSGDSFPACDTCHDQVRFRLIRTAPYIFQDEDFEVPE